jgi:hypothetical protein
LGSNATIWLRGRKVAVLEAREKLRLGYGLLPVGNSVGSPVYGCVSETTLLYVLRTAYGAKFEGYSHWLPEMPPKKRPAAPWITVLPFP